MHRRGQAALEFLTTYGWAFLIILVMIGAISYFGILNPSKLLPARCTTSSEFSCEDYKIDTTVSGGIPYGRITLQLKQGVGKTIFLKNLTCSYESAAPILATSTAGAMNLPAGLAWSPRNSMPFECLIPEASELAGQKIKILYDISYTKSTTGLTHTASGEVYAEVQG